MPGDLIIKEEYSDGITRVMISGEADIYTSSQIKEKLYNIVDSRKTDIKIDCNELSYIDSTGLGIFAGTLKRAKQYGRNVYLAGLKSNIKKLFTITGLDKLFIMEE
ncbi:MAG: STAS domain-containing protein [Clostridiaceae bacterium]|nr:STAS domain-containing protein [Clostridiaceae bacterium]